MKHHACLSLVLLFITSISFVGARTFAGPYKPTNQETSPDEDSDGSSSNSGSGSAKKFAGDAATGPFLTIKSQGEVKKFSRADLLKSPYLKKLSVENDPTYKKKMTYSVVPVTQLFGSFKIADNNTINFYSLDGFSAPISTERLLNASANAA